MFNLILKKKKPQIDFFIVGAQKAGTTALYNILLQHPCIEGGKTKEIHYFDKDKNFEKINYNNYHNLFPEKKKRILQFDVTPTYLYHPKCAERIYKYNSKAKIIITLREPANRAYSAWNMYNNFINNEVFRHLHDNRSFEQAIKDEYNKIENTNWYTDTIAYVRRGIYYEQIERYLKFFPRKNIFVTEANELREQSDSVLKKTQKFLTIPFFKLKTTKSNVGKYKNTRGIDSGIDSEIENLKEFYKPYNEKLFQLLNKRYNW